MFLHKQTQSRYWLEAMHGNLSTFCICTIRIPTVEMWSGIFRYDWPPICVTPDLCKWSIMHRLIVSRLVTSPFLFMYFLILFFFLFFFSCFLISLNAQPIRFGYIKYGIWKMTSTRTTATWALINFVLKLELDCKILEWQCMPGEDNCLDHLDVICRQYTIARR